ncbi:RICIN domain-containing protein [Nonomuraea rhodomycinica]|uniref:RICIN domain-containing protein n=1 Tax=Nonomuraea rhodomycinica TaxID=1712872 RepID=A0A7Y6IIW5_9ACTN|nr:RICIN domain-containing protein [Nonomuraea rhodomycinica]NUW38528.1 RICIN domain-containing protein [Nonomuraea rhodomycinica]
MNKLLLAAALSTAACLVPAAAHAADHATTYATTHPADQPAPAPISAQPTGGPVAPPPGPGPLALGGFFQVQEAEQSRCLDVKDASTAENALLQRITCKGNDAQLWQPTLLSSDGSGTFVYQLSNRGSGKCVEVRNEVAAFGAQVVQHTCDPSRLAGERWLHQGEIPPTGVGFGPFRSALDPSMCLDTLGQLAKVFTCTSPNDAQLWRLQ